MKHRSIFKSLLAIILLSLLTVNSSQAEEPAGDISAQAAVGTAFTYQGRLRDAGGPVNGTCDFRFRLYNAASGGSLLGTDTVNGVPVSDGYFGVVLNDSGEFGGNAFDGQARWMEIRVNCGSGDTDLSPRQPLTAAPYAHYALSAPWSGLSGVPAGLNDGDDDTTYTAGTGLTLSGGQFSLTAGYRLPQGCSNGQIAEWNGSAWVCGNDDVGSGGGPHNHLGETWTGSNNPLVIDGSFSDAPLVLGNDDGAGLFVGWANDDGVYVDAAGDDGVYVYSAGNPSTETASSSHNGFEVAGAEGNGLYVGRADNHGVRVSSAGNAGVSVSSAWNGVVVGFAGDDGFYVYSANDDGVFVDTAGDDGVFVKWAGDDGVYVHSAGNPSDRNPSAGQNGFEVAGAEGFGLYVGRADVNGVEVNSAGYDGIYVLSADRRAATFNGDVLVTGYLTKQGGGFKIDHPLDPQNQYLNHSFVEAPDMMNIYNGNVILDANGEAWVELPDWFEALNQDFRYQLTAIGGPGPGLYIAEEIQDNRFKIAGGEAGLKVSWQVTGIRHDPFAEANRLPVEEQKPAEERGTYLDPEVYGRPETEGLIYQDAQNLGLEEESGPEQSVLAEPQDHP